MLWRRSVSEIWKDIKRYKGFYQVSSLGRIKSLSRRVRKYNGYKINKERILKDTKHSIGYRQVTLCKKGVTKTFLVHRLVADAFVDNPLKLSQVNHRDTNKTNNIWVNLEWTDAVGNLTHAVANKLIPLGEDMYKSTVSNTDVLKICDLLDAKELSHEEIADKFGIKRGVVSAINAGISWNWLTHRKGSNRGRGNKGLRHSAARKVINCRGEVFNTITEASISYKIFVSGIHNVLGKENRTSGKYPDGTRIKWNYYENLLDRSHEH